MPCLRPPSAIVPLAPAMVEEAEAGSETSGEPVTFSCRPICRSHKETASRGNRAQSFLFQFFMLHKLRRI